MIKKQPNMNRGAAILFVIFGLLFFVLLFHFASIQITGEASGHTLAAKAQQKYLKKKSIDAKRGTIYDKNGEVIAKDAASYKLVAILDKSMTTNPKKPNHVQDPEMTAAELSKYIEMSKQDIYKQLTQKGLFQVEFGKAGKDISHKTKNKIEELKLPGITFIPERKRFYPNGIFASHLIGFVEKETTDGTTSAMKGILGIEKTQNSILEGIDGNVTFESDLWGYVLPDGKQKVTPAKDGKDIYLTIDKKIQTFLEDALNKVNEQYKPEQIMAIVASPKTGEILAMGQRPSFHPHTRVGINDSWHNLVVENSFEPGSTMKIFTLAAAVEEGVFNANETFKSGSYKVTPNSKAIHDHKREGWGTINFLEGVQRSSNVGFARLVSEKLGYETYREYITKFGFEQPTGIDLPNEANGKIVYQYPIDKITTGFGQGSAITPIQQIQAAMAIANNGSMMKPHVIDKIVDPNTGDVIKDVKPEVAGTPISAETAEEVRDILETTISSKKGTGYNRYNIEGYQVAGKTGTAQIPGDNGYLTGRENYIFSFLGMAPKDDPELVIYVAVKQPELENTQTGSMPVSMIFKSIMKNSLQYLNIKPADIEKSDIMPLPDVSSLSVRSAIKALEQNGVTPVVIGEGNKVIQQFPAPGEKLLEGEKVILKTNGDLTMPDMTGWSRRDVMKAANVTDLRLTISGSGYVISQNIKPGSKFKTGSYFIVKCKSPTEAKEDSKKDKKDSDEIETLD